MLGGRLRSQALEPGSGGLGGLLVPPLIPRGSSHSTDDTVTYISDIHPRFPAHSYSPQPLQNKVFHADALIANGQGESTMLMYEAPIKT